jgi:hypothetical protein
LPTFFSPFARTTLPPHDLQMRRKKCFNPSLAP